MTARIVEALKVAAGELSVLLPAQFGTGSGDRFDASMWPLCDPAWQPQ
jgi:hypothetical protein